MGRHLRLEKTGNGAAYSFPTRSGYRRDGAPNVWLADAVAWWYVSIDGDYVFARGGRVRTARLAREELRQARAAHARDREVSRRQKKLRHKLGPEGELVPL